MAEPRVVKRYANRKLYDTQRSRYVTLDQIAEMIRSGEDVKIVDNNSKEDLTAITLAQIIFEEEKKSSFMPLSALRNIIQTGGQSIQQFASQTGEKVRSVFRRQKEDGTFETEEEALAAGDEPQQAGQQASSIREFLDRSQQTFEEWQKKVDERIRTAVDAINPMASLEKEVKTLSQRLAELEKRLDS
ncbi:MAG TPA: polyhydroxyalkanoate synthesis regulator DNA-binding domain-containing protein, partial [Polyangia bacterium]